MSVRPSPRRAYRWRRATVLGALAVGVPLAAAGLPVAGEPQVIAVVPTPPPQQIVVDRGSGRVFVLHPDAVTVLDGTRVVEAVPVPTAGFAQDLDFNAATNTLYVTDPFNLHVVDGATYSPLATIFTGPQTFKLAIHEPTNTIWVGTTFAGLRVVDGATNAIVDTLPLFGVREDLAVGGSRVHVPRTDVTTVDAATRQIVAQVPLAAPAPVLDLALDPLAGRLYAVSDATSTLSVVDTSTSSLVASVPMAGIPASSEALAVNPATGHVYYLSSSDPNWIQVVDGATLGVLRTIATGPSFRPRIVDVRSDPNRAYVFVERFTFPDPDPPEQIWVLDDETAEIVATVEIGQTPLPSLAVDPDRSRIYAGSFDPPGVYVLSDPPPNTAPTADAGADVAAECSSSAGVTVTLDGSGSTDPDSTPGTRDDLDLFRWYEDFGLPTEALLGTGETLAVSFPLGTHAVTLEVTDLGGLSDADDVTVTVVDTAEPTISVALAPGLLWPPNHRLVPIEAGVTATDACGSPSIVLLSVTSNEPDDGAGDGNTTGDVRDAYPGTADFAFLLRAERSARGSGRVYTATYEATDGSGNTAEAAGLVVVPLSPRPLPPSEPGPSDGDERRRPGLGPRDAGASEPSRRSTRDRDRR